MRKSVTNYVNLYNNTGYSRGMRISLLSIWNSSPLKRSVYLEVTELLILDIVGLPICFGEDLQIFNGFF